jgi:hypothetical protein
MTRTTDKPNFSLIGVNKVNFKKTQKKTTLLMSRPNITKINFIKINLTNYWNTGATPPSVLAELGAFELSPPPLQSHISVTQ